jgi:hypothetical protein
MREYHQHQSGGRYVLATASVRLAARSLHYNGHAPLGTPSDKLNPIPPAWYTIFSWNTSGLRSVDSELKSPRIRLVTRLVGRSHFKKAPWCFLSVNLSKSPLETTDGGDLRRETHISNRPRTITGKQKRIFRKVSFSSPERSSPSIKLRGDSGWVNAQRNNPTKKRHPNNQSKKSQDRMLNLVHPGGLVHKVSSG